MRITGGYFGGRRVQVARGLALRPTQDRVREALFSSLAAEVPGSAFLDLYAGVGMVGLEAWSRGARRVCWVERDRRVYASLKANVARLAASGAEPPGVLLEPRQRDVLQYLRGPCDEFDVVYADPPYRRHGGPGGDRVMAAIVQSAICRVGGMLVLEQGSEEDGPEGAGFRLDREKRYGGSLLRIYRRERD